MDGIYKKGQENVEDNKNLLYYLNKISLSLENINNNMEKIANSSDENKLLEINSLDIKNIPDLTSSNETFVNEEIKNTFIKYNRIKQKLEDENIQIKKVDESVDDFDKIAIFMGNKYKLIKSIYILMKRELNSKIGVKIDLKNKSHDEISAITNLCTKLYNIAFLEDYNYAKFSLFFKTGKIPLGISFLTGNWFERYVFTSIKDIFISNNIEEKEYEIITNIHVILSDNNITELDILVYYNNKYFWIEVKTGSYQKFIEKYLRLTSKLKFHDSFFIHIDIDEETSIQLSKIMNMHATNIQKFKDVLKNKILY